METLAKENVKIITSGIAKTLEIPINPMLVQNVIDFIRAFPRSGKSLSEFQAAVITAYSRRYSAELQNNSAHDMRQNLANEINSLSKNENSYKFSAHANRTALTDRTVEETSLIHSCIPALQTYNNIIFPKFILPLDSRNKSLSSGNLRWNINYSGNAGQIGDMLIRDNIKEIIKIKTCGFWLPIPDDAILKDTLTQYGKVRMCIQEFFQKAEATEFLDKHEKNPTLQSYHFEYDIKEWKKNVVYLKPCISEFFLQKPVARLESITLLFRSPFSTIELPKDRDFFTLIPGNPSVIQTNTPHELDTGDLIYINQFTSGNNSIDSQMNSISGHKATRINSTHFSILVNSNSIDSTRGNVIYGSKRIILQLEMTCLEL